MTTIEVNHITGVNASNPYYNEYFYYDVNMAQMCLTAETKNNCSTYGWDLNGNPIVPAQNSTCNNNTPIQRVDD